MNRAYSFYIALITLSACSDKANVPENPEPEEPIVVTCDQDPCWDESVYVCRDTHYIDLFTRSTGWTGGDATYSVELGPDRRVWMFGDTFIDQVNPDRSRPSFRLINNSLVLQEGDELTTFYGGSKSAPKAFATPPEDGDWYWPGDGTYINGKLYLFMHGFGNDTGGAWDFYRTSVDLITVDPTSMEILSSERIIDNPEISWGAALLEDDTYTYVYGVKADGLSKQLYVGRTNADLSAAWEFYANGNWVTDRASASPLLEGVSEQFSVFKSGGTYYLLTQHNLFGKEIYLYTGSAPQGPFADKRIVYCTPETEGNIYTYNAFVHTNAYSDSLLISYNVNSFDYQDLLASADNYRPYFVRIGNWKTGE